MNQEINQDIDGLSILFTFHGRERKKEEGKISKKAYIFIHCIRHSTSTHFLPAFLPLVCLSGLIHDFYSLSTRVIFTMNLGMHRAYTVGRKSRPQLIPQDSSPLGFPVSGPLMEMLTPLTPKKTKRGVGHSSVMDSKPRLPGEGLGEGLSGSLFA